MEAKARQIVTALSRLENLRTLNIRNMPEVSYLQFGLVEWLNIDDLCQSLITSLLKRVVDKYNYVYKPNLDVVILGGLTYRDVYDASRVWDAHPLDDFLRLRVYRAEYILKRPENTFITNAKLEAKGYSPRIKLLSDQLHILDQYWLG